MSITKDAQVPTATVDGLVSILVLFKFSFVCHREDESSWVRIITPVVWVRGSSIATKDSVARRFNQMKSSAVSSYLLVEGFVVEAVS